MDPKILGVIVFAIVIVAVIAIFLVRGRRKAALRRRFGPEYERAVRESGSEREAQAMLAERERRDARRASGGQQLSKPSYLHDAHQATPRNKCLN